MQGVDVLQNILQSYLKYRYLFFKWRNQLAFAQMLAMTAGMACLTGVLAQVRFYLPWTPVPIVASQIGVILAAVILGKRWGAISMLIYAIGGFAGIPWFAGYKGGIAALTSPTAGYIVGFILAALFIGHIVDTRPQTCRVLPLMAITLFAQLFLVYLPGLIGLALWSKLVQGEMLSLAALLWMGYIPFILGDVLKSTAGAFIIKGLVPAEDFHQSQESE